MSLICSLYTTFALILIWKHHCPNKWTIFMTHTNTHLSFTGMCFVTCFASIYTLWYGLCNHLINSHWHWYLSCCYWSRDMQNVLAYVLRVSKILLDSGSCLICLSTSISLPLHLPDFPILFSLLWWLLFWCPLILLCPVSVLGCTRADVFYFLFVTLFMSFTYDLLQLAQRIL